VVTLAFGFLLARFRVGLLAAYVGLAPFGSSFVQGIVDYANGQARLRTMGGPWHPELENLDPKWRCQWQSGGCVVHGHEWMHHEPYNFAVQSMIATFGFMPGKYTGPYPNREEAYAAIGGNTWIPIRQLQFDRIPLGSAEYALAPGVGKRILNLAQTCGIGPPEVISAKATLWRDECIIVYLTLSGIMTIDGENLYVLISRDTGEPFASYIIPEIR
jgi:hypothetical protein